MERAITFVVECDEEGDYNQLSETLHAVCTNHQGITNSFMCRGTTQEVITTLSNLLDLS